MRSLNREPLGPQDVKESQGSGKKTDRNNEINKGISAGAYAQKRSNTDDTEKGRKESIFPHRPALKEMLLSTFRRNASIQYVFKTGKRLNGKGSKYPPAQPGALCCEPLKAAVRGR